MDRSMSYELDHVFSSRNAGELVSVQQTKTRVLRSPGLKNLSRPLSRPIKHTQRTRIAGPQDRRLTQGRPTYAATGLADAYSPMDGIMIPGLNIEVSWTSLAIGAGIGVAALMLFRRR